MKSIRYKNANKWLGQPATGQGVIPSAAGALPTTAPWRVVTVRLHNRTGSAMGCALVGFMADARWEAGQWVNATTTYTADTTDAQDAGTNDFALETTTQNDGFVVGADRKFGAVSVDVTTAGSGTSPTHVVEYWNGAWTAIAAAGMLIDVPRSADWGAGEAVILFDPPVDWIVGGSGTGISQTRFNIRMRRTNATQATAALARRIYVGEIITSLSSVGVDAAGETRFGVPGLLWDAYNLVGVNGVFVTADEGNLMEIFYHEGLWS